MMVGWLKAVVKVEEKRDAKNTTLIPDDRPPKDSNARLILKEEEREKEKRRRRRGPHTFPLLPPLLLLSADVASAIASPTTVLDHHFLSSLLLPPATIPPSPLSQQPTHPQPPPTGRRCLPRPRTTTARSPRHCHTTAATPPLQHPSAISAIPFHLLFSVVDHHLPLLLNHSRSHTLLGRCSTYAQPPSSSAAPSLAAASFSSLIAVVFFSPTAVALAGLSLPSSFLPCCRSPHPYHPCRQCFLSLGCFFLRRPPQFLLFITADHPCHFPLQPLQPTTATSFS
ncbi:hypothetical protein BHE74_00022124 [Ensete ventricosum]|nr:hypothetical protein BHE74_00022124 [Ensete ventricosum]